IEDKNETKNNRTINLLEENLPEGVYKIELKSNDDIITKQIKTKQNKLSFINKLWLYKSNKENINLFTDSKVLHAKTVYPTSLQNIQINTEELKIEETYTQFSTNIKKASNTKYTIIEIEHDGIVLACDEVFSFTENSMINPRMKKVGNNIDINNEGINYVLAKYKSPKKKDDWKIVEIEFDLTKAYREDGKYNFLISAPSFKLDDKLKNGILIDEISINLESVKLIDKIRKKFSNQ
ncbi:hypothetical protein KAI92_04965, partial [Candidatus Parcubacteria bacterium]|nr:hypothetical protein [Candidatus Parcubacteria bacterium]